MLDDIVMKKFVLVPEVCPIGSMTSAAEPTFLPALSEVYSPVESDTARVSALPVSAQRSSGSLFWEGRLGFSRFEG